jgi:hypothetical protein
VQTVLIACGIAAPVLHVVMDDVIAAALYPGYDRIAQPVSELSATYAPCRAVLFPLGIAFQLLPIILLRAQRMAAPGPAEWRPGQESSPAVVRAA